MTKAITEIDEKNFYMPVLNIAALIFIFLFSILLAPEINKYIKSGLSLCFEAIIGSVFPFMIITDIMNQFNSLEKIGRLRIVFERVFKINGYAISAFVLGTLCGFPVGAKIAADMHKRKIITKDECERLIAFSCNMGPAFVISGVGVALCKSLIIGIILYMSSVISAFISGALIGIGKTASNKKDMGNEGSFSLVNSVKSASVNTINICGFILLFSAVCGLLLTFINNRFLYIFLVSLLEVSNAAKLISAVTFIPYNLKLSLLSFSVSFSGLSILTQAKSFVSTQNITMKTYLYARLIQGLISFTLTYLMLFLI